MKESKIDITLKEVTHLINEKYLSASELISLLGQLTIQIGYSLYYLDKENKPDLIDEQEANRLALEDPDIGSSLMKLGYDIHNIV